MWNKTGYNVQELRERLRREGENTMRKTESQKIALCGMLGALSVVLLLIGSALQSAPTLRRCSRLFCSFRCWRTTARAMR